MAGFHGGRVADTSITIDLQKIVSDQMKAIHAAIEAGCHEILREAYEAGYERGSDDEAYASRGVGPHTDRPPTFEEFVADLIERNRPKF